jgi:hypothetical protein
MKSTVKIDDLYGVEIGEYAIALEDGTVVYKQFPDSSTQFEVTPDDSGEVDVTEEQETWAASINEQLTGMVQFAQERDIPISEVETAPEEAEEGVE